MSIETKVPKELLRSSGPRYATCLNNTLRSYGALSVLAVDEL
jgi:hypothetical protein